MRVGVNPAARLADRGGDSAKDASHLPTSCDARGPMLLAAHGCGDWHGPLRLACQSYGETGECWEEHRGLCVWRGTLVRWFEVWRGPLNPASIWVVYRVHNRAVTLEQSRTHSLIPPISPLSDSRRSRSPLRLLATCPQNTCYAGAIADMLTGADTGFHNLSNNFLLVKFRKNGVRMCQRVSTPSALLRTQRGIQNPPAGSPQSRVRLEQVGPSQCHAIYECPRAPNAFLESA